MLPFSPERSVFQASKCFFSYGTMGHIDPAQPPSFEKTTPAGQQRVKKPWSSLNKLDFVGQVDVIVPQECAGAVCEKLIANRPPAQYSRAVMTLGQILTGDFFKEYVKAGNILMLSEGRAGQDNVFLLRDGQLTLFLDRESYERAGLVGKPHGTKGDRYLRPRWVVEFDLNSKSMWPGKKGFDRLIYACKNVFNTPQTWLFYNKFDTPSPDPLAAFSPSLFSVEPTISDPLSVQHPLLVRPASLLKAESGDRMEIEEAVSELYEWLSLVRLGSPRVSQGDSIDPYLSRYQIPSAMGEKPTPGDICVIRWQGFFPSTWVCQTLLDLILAMPSTKTWFSVSVSAFPRTKGLPGDGAECTFFRPAKAPGEYLLWEVHGYE